MGQSESGLPASDTVTKVALKAVYDRDLKSLTRFLSWVDKRKLNRAVQQVRGGKKHPRLESYIQKVLMNSVKVKWAANGKKNISMMRSRNVESLVIRYYFRGASGGSVQPMLSKMVKRIRHRIHVRLHRMSDDELRRRFSISN